MRKPLMGLAVAGCFVMAIVGGLLPFIQGWIFFVLGLYLLASEFETGRRWVVAARRRWPFLSRWIAAGHRHPWAPKRFRDFDDLTDPEKQAPAKQATPT